MADDSTEGVSRVQFRDDILRGVRLFAIAFAGILVCVFAYRTLRSPFEAQGAQQELAPPEAPPAASQEMAPDPAPSPAVEASTEQHGLVVPPPPPVGGASAAAARRVVRPKSQAVSPPPQVAHANRPSGPSPRDFESAEVGGTLPSGKGEESSETNPAPGKKGVGYKSLLEANANRLPEEPAGEAAPEESKQGKGNRFFKAVGKIFHVGGKKEPAPSALQPKQDQ